MLVSLLLNTLAPMSQTLLGQARQHSSAGQHQFAVVLAHAACEWYTEEALNNVIRLKDAQLLGEVVMSLVGSTLEDGRVRRLYAALTGDYPAGDKKLGRKRASWWHEWQAGRVLRHSVAHKATAHNTAADRGSGP